MVFGSSRCRGLDTVVADGAVAAVVDAAAVEETDSLGDVDEVFV